MSEPVKKSVTVVGAQYSKESKSAVLLVESSEGRFYSQLHIKSLLPNVSNLECFTEDQIVDCMKVFCNSIIGKKINVVFDPDLNDKLRDKYPLKY